MEQTGITLGEAMSLANNNCYGGNAMWNNPFMYLMFMNMMNGGFWGGNRGNLATQTDVYAANDSQSMRTAINNLGNGLADVGYAITNNIKDGNASVNKNITDVGAGVAKAITDVGAGMAMGFCNTNHNIDNLKYENAKNTADIIANGHADTQRILDKLCISENMQLRQELADAKLANSQFAQNAYLIEKLTPAT